MPMISYAQNREDVLLRRAFPRPCGFYIDVGAAHPVSHSVTKWFYDQGWSGVNVEPLDVFFQLLVDDRPRDINLNLVLSDKSGEISLYEVPSSIGWATVDAGTSARYQADGVIVAPRSVSSMTLSELCERYARDPIDFLKVDVEGAEAAVLAGADFTRWRPRVLVVEATEVGKPTANYGSWEPMVLAADYEFATFDGLNRYYVRSEERELASLLAVPANVFDDYILAETVHEREAGQQARHQLAIAHDELTLARAKLSESSAEIEALKKACTDSRKAYDIALRFLDQTRADLDTMRSAALRLAS